MTLPELNLLALAPEIILILAALVVLICDLLVADKRILGWLSLIAISGAALAVIFVKPASPAVQDMMLADRLGRIASLAVLVAAGFCILSAIDRVTEFTERVGPFYALVLLATVGMTAMTIASNFMTIFLALEILSVALYILVGFYREDVRSGEAALKYFLLGAFASAFFLYGIALVYAATGSISLTAIGQGMAPLSVALPFAPLLPIGVGLLLAGFGFKLALVPFHMWTPDAYQAAPTSVTAFMSVATKAAVFLGLIRVLAALASYSRPWLLALAGLAVLTMTLGNFAALRQNRLKRMLAYSSIAQAGYVVIGLAAGSAKGTQAALYYLLAYTFMNFGAFAVILAVQGPDENDVTREQITGLGTRQPALAAIMAIFMFSLAGIPPLAGFFGKLFVFGAAVEADLVWLAIIGAINSAVAAFYYLRVTVVMYMAAPAGQPAEPSRGPETAPGLRVPWPIWAVLVIAAAGTLILGLWQYPWMQGITQAVAAVVP